MRDDTLVAVVIRTSPSHDHKPAGGRHRPRLTVLVKLLGAFAVPAVALFTVFAVVAHEVARDDLDAELGTRLQAIAASAALQIRGKHLVGIGPGDQGHRAYQNSRSKLLAAQAATGVSRMYIFDRDFRSVVAPAAEVPIGGQNFQAELDRHEILRVYNQGVATSSVLFQGADGALYKAGYAPVRASEREEDILFALGVEAPAAYFERLADLRSSLIVYGVVLALVVLAISIVVAAFITRPVRDLVGAAERIARGDLARPIRRRSRDEIGFLAETMEEMRRDLSARDERMQLMLSGIAHEVRNPLGGIELFAGILRDELDSDDERRSHVQRIEKEMGYLKAVVNDFLDYARRPPPQRTELDLAEMAADVVELVRADADHAGVPISLQADPAPCQVDAGQLRRALLNLTRNAVQASAGAEGGEVWVTVARAGQGARLDVANRGAPIPDDIRERIFEPFFTTREKGTGLGLAFVREIIADHGGHIAVQCSRDRTAFVIDLP